MNQRRNRNGLFMQDFLRNEMIRFQKVESGVEAIEWVAMAAAFLVVIVGVMFLFKLIPDPTGQISSVIANGQSAVTPLIDVAVPIALLTILAAAGGFMFRQFVSRVDNATKLLILEILSDRKPKSRHEIRALLKKKDVVYRISQLEIDALASLVADERVTLENGLYKIARPQQKGNSKK